MEAFLAATYQQTRAQRPEQPKLLSNAAAQLLWQLTAPEGLLGLSEAAAEAWQLLHRWQIPRDALAYSENGRAFARWCERLEAELANAHAITTAQLPEVLMSHVSLMPQRIATLGFEVVTPALAACWSARSSSGGEVHALDYQPAAPEAMTHRVEFASEAIQINAIAQWAKQRLASAADAEHVRIGVVLPNLAQQLATVERQFAAEFGDAGAGMFDIAGGVPLGDQPIWQAARSVLQLALTRLPTQQLLATLHSPYHRLPRPWQLPAGLGDSVTLWQLAHATGDETLVRLNRLCPPPDARFPLEHWWGLFEQLLTSSGFPCGRRLPLSTCD